MSKASWRFLRWIAFILGAAVITKWGKRWFGEDIGMVVQVEALVVLALITWDYARSTKAIAAQYGQEKKDRAKTSITLLLTEAKFNKVVWESWRESLKQGGTKYMEHPLLPFSVSERREVVRVAGLSSENADDILRVYFHMERFNAEVRDWFHHVQERSGFLETELKTLQKEKLGEKLDGLVKVLGDKMKELDAA